MRDVHGKSAITRIASAPSAASVSAERRDDDERIAEEPLIDAGRGGDDALVNTEGRRSAKTTTATRTIVGKGRKLPLGQVVGHCAEGFEIELFTT